MKTIIHVNQHKIKSNAKTGRREPVLTCKTYKSNDYAFEVEILGPSKVVYSPDKPLPCGAKVWIQTESEVVPIPRALKIRERMIPNPYPVEGDEDKPVKELYLEDSSSESSDSPTL